MMRLVLLYLLLVGFPIMAICGLLKVGQRLSAPVSVAGTWNAQLSFPESSASALMISPGVKVLKISQSGPQVFLTFEDERKITLAGNIQEMRLYAGLLDDPGASTDPPETIHFRGQINRQTDPEQLSGMLIVDRGPVRTEIRLTALRERRPPVAPEAH